jgi:hypothetical protein
LKEWVIHTIPAMNWQLDEGKSHWMSMMRLRLTHGLDDQPGVSLSHGYYNNFVRHVLDSYSQGLLAQKKVTSYEAVSQHGSNALRNRT